MENPTTFVSLILDRSGSMVSVHDEAIHAVNNFVKELKEGKKGDGKVVPISKADDRCLFTLTLFNSNQIDIKHKAVPVEGVPLFTADDYQPSGFTPLYDAIAKTIQETARAIGEKKDWGPAVIFVIMTDGEENASREFDREKVRRLIEAKQEIGWNFVYLGANQDAWLEGSKVGFSMSNTSAYVASNIGSQGTVTGQMVNCYRARAGGQSMSVSNLMDPPEKWNVITTPQAPPDDPDKGSAA